MLTKVCPADGTTRAPLGRSSTQAEKCKKYELAASLWTRNAEAKEEEEEHAEDHVVPVLAAAEVER